MKKAKGLLLSLIVLVIISFVGINSAKASHMMGSDITWTCIGQDSFIIKLVIYRDCNGVQLGAASIPIKCASTGASVMNVSIAKPAPVDITPTCGASCTRCQTSSCTFPYGIEQYTFTKLVVLSGAGSCCKLTISYTMCCRNGSITTGAANANFFVDAQMDRCVSPCDNSPSFSNPPVAIICIGQDFVFNHGVTDMDFDPNGGLMDSLSYEWTPPLSSAGSSISYTGQYSYDKPVFFWGMPNASLPFPRGFHLDKVTGDISFRPMKIEQTVFAIKIGEWREINGVMTLIGYVRRDIQVIVISCPNNNAPVLSGPFYKEVCATNTVNFSIATNDYDVNDTLLISWNGAIPGATWADNNKQTKHPTGTLSWTPGEQYASTIPYVFTVTVKDDACPVNGSSTRAYQILVKPLPKANITKVDSGCGNYWLFAQGILGNSPSYTWVGNFNPGFVNVGPAMNYKFKKPGKYPFTLTVEAQQCQRVYYDTIQVDTFLYLNLTPDHDICYGDTSTLVAGYLYNSGDVNYLWSNGDTVQTVKYRALKDTFFAVVLQDTLGCVVKDTVFINMHNLPLVSLGADRHLCSYSTEVIPATYSFDQSSLQTITWTDLKTGNPIATGINQITITDSGYWKCTVEDTLGCIGDDKLQAFVNDEMIAYAQGAVICYGDTATLTATSTGSKTSNVQYRWYNVTTGGLVGITQTIRIRPLATTDYKLLVKETQFGVECRDSTQLRVRVNPLPQISFSPIPERCVDGAMLGLNSYVTTNPLFCTKTWTSPSDGLLSIYPGDKFHPLVGGAGTHKVVLTATDPSTNCINMDSTVVVINALPKPDAGMDVSICTGDGIYVLDGKPSLPAGTWQSLQGVGVVGSPGSYHFDPNASGVSNGSTYDCVYHYIDIKSCENEDTVKITVYETPVVEAGSYPDICINASPKALNGTPAGGTWTSNKPGAIVGNSFYPDKAGLGSHELTYTFTNVICTVEDKVTITVRPLPTISVGTRLGATSFCSNNGYIELVGNPVGGVWTGPADAIAYDKFFNTSIGSTSTTETSYDLTYTYQDQYGCENSKILTVTVRPAPEIEIDKNAKSLCFPATYNVSATYKNASGVEWYRDFDSASGTFAGDITSTSIGYSPSQSDLVRLYFWLKIRTTHPDNICAAVYDSIRVDMSAVPNAGFMIDPQEGCTPHTAAFTDTSSIDIGKIVSWSWSFGDGNTSTLQHPNHTYTEAGHYTVKLKVKSNANCSDEQSEWVKSHVVPDAGFIPEPELALISAPNISFKNTTQGETAGVIWRWNFGDYSEPDGGSSSMRDPEYKYHDTGSYMITLYVDNEYGCKDTARRNVIIMPDVLAYVPTAFSPEAAKLDENKIFRVVVEGISEFELKIFSRWGELLYESYDYTTHGWKGTYLKSDDRVPMDVYVYVMKLKGLDGIDYKYTGTITLLK
ncbi:PKD domain-containing protein [Bacteroidota bacterium]